MAGAYFIILDNPHISVTTFSCVILRDGSSRSRACLRVCNQDEWHYQNTSLESWQTDHLMVDRQSGRGSKRTSLRLRSYYFPTSICSRCSALHPLPGNTICDIICHCMDSPRSWSSPYQHWQNWSDIVNCREQCCESEKLKIITNPAKHRQEWCLVSAERWKAYMVCIDRASSSFLEQSHYLRMMVQIGERNRTCNPLQCYVTLGTHAIQTRCRKIGLYRSQWYDSSVIAGLKLEIAVWHDPTRIEFLI